MHLKYHSSGASHPHTLSFTTDDNTYSKGFFVLLFHSGYCRHCENAAKMYHSCLSASIMTQLSCDCQTSHAADRHQSYNQTTSKDYSSYCNSFLTYHWQTDRHKYDTLRISPLSVSTMHNILYENTTEITTLLCWIHYTVSTLAVCFFGFRGTYNKTHGLHCSIFTWMNTQRRCTQGPPWHKQTPCNDCNKIIILHHLDIINVTQLLK